MSSILSSIKLEFLIVELVYRKSDIYAIFYFICLVPRKNSVHAEIIDFFMGVLNLQL